MEGLSGVDARSPATSLALNDLQSALMKGLLSSSGDGDLAWQHVIEDGISTLLL